MPSPKEQLRALLDFFKTDPLAYDARTPPKRDHTAYDLAATEELVEILRLVRRLVDQAVREVYPDGQWPREDSVGRPIVYPPPDLTKILLVQQYFALGNRQAVSAALIFQEKLGIAKVPSYKTIERAYEDPDVRKLVAAIQRISAAPYASVEHVLGMDGTGVPRSTTVNYASRRAGQRKERDRREGTEQAAPIPTDDHGVHHAYVPLVLAAGLETKLIVDQVVHPGRSLVENPHFPELFRRARRIWSDLRIVPLDSAYWSRETCTLIEEAGALPRIMPRKNVSFLRKGSDAWVHMHHDLLRDPVQWMRDYHLRSGQEGINRVFHWKSARVVRRKRPVRIVIEQDVRAVAYNLQRLTRLNYLFPNVRAHWT